MTIQTQRWAKQLKNKQKATTRLELTLIRLPIIKYLPNRHNLLEKKLTSYIYLNLGRPRSNRPFLVRFEPLEQNELQNMKSKQKLSLTYLLYISEKLVGPSFCYDANPLKNGIWNNPDKMTQLAAL